MNIFGSHCEIANVPLFFVLLSMTIYDLKFIHCPFHYYNCIAVQFCSAELVHDVCLCDLKMADKLFDDKWLLYLDFKFWCWSCIFRFF